MADTARFDTDEEPRESLVQRALVLAVAPIRILTSRTAVKAYVSTLLFLATSTILLAVSSTAYAFFYYNYIPQINLERVLYLQYGAGPFPHATVLLDTTALITQQAYDVELILNMPRTPTNLDAGNFMLDLALLGPGPGPKAPGGRLFPDPFATWLANFTAEHMLHRSRRPAMLPYASPIVSLSHTLLHLPWHLLRLRDLDASHLMVPMFEMLSFPRGSRNLPTHARLELQSSSVLQVYDAKLAFRARFQGMRYLVYHYRVTGFVVFTTLFYGISVTTMAVAWAVISYLLSPGDADAPEHRTIKEEGEGAGDGDSAAGWKKEGPSARVKTEDDTESSTVGLSLSQISDTPAQFPTARGQAPSEWEGRTPLDDPEDDGANDDAPIVEAAQGEAADDEQEEGGDDDDDDAAAAKDARGRPFDGDSGMGTSMESEHTTAGLVRRRSSRGLSSR